MKKNNKIKNSNKSNVTNKNNNKVTNSSNENNSIGFDTTSNSKSFKYDENADHSFELRDCK